MGQLEPAVPTGQDVVWLCLNFLHRDMRRDDATPTPLLWGDPKSVILTTDALCSPISSVS